MNLSAIDVIPEFGSRLSYAVPRERENLIKEKARKSGVLPRVRDAPLKDQLAARIKEFQTNVELTAMLERRHSLDTQMLQRMQAEERLGEITQTTSPPFRTGLADFAAAGRAAERVARPRAFDLDDIFEDDAAAEERVRRERQEAGSYESVALVETVFPNTTVNDMNDMLRVGRDAKNNLAAAKAQQMTRNPSKGDKPRLRDRSIRVDPRDTVG